MVYGGREPARSRLRLLNGDKMVNGKGLALEPAGRMRVRTAVLLGVSLFGLLASPAAATNYIFTGNGTTANWSDAANWTPAGPPSGNSDVELAQSGTHAPSNFDISRTFSSLTILTPSDPTSLANGYVVNAGGGVFTMINDFVLVDNSSTHAANLVSALLGIIEDL